MAKFAAWRNQHVKQIANLLPEAKDNDDLAVLENLCDLIEGRPMTPPTTWERIRALRWGPIALGGALVVALGADFGVPDSIAVAMRGEPYSYNVVTLMTPVVRADDQLKFHINTLRQRVCAWSWDRYWQEIADGQTILIARDKEPGVSVVKINQPVQYDILTPLPHGIAPGYYVVSFKALIECSHGDRFGNEVGPFQFEVVAD